MNKELYLQSLQKYKVWCSQNMVKLEDEIKEREEIIKHYMHVKSSDFDNMDEEGICALLTPLWAMKMWGNKQKKSLEIIELNGLSLLRSQLKNLLFSSNPIDIRWDEFREKVKGIGPATMSELLCRFHPYEYILWNDKTLTGFSNLEVEKIPKTAGTINGKTYKYLCKVGVDMVVFAKDKGAKEIDNMLALNYFVWQELQNIDDIKAEDSNKISKKESLFVHNDIRDRLKDIGNLLGFHAETEVHVANGANVDTTWQVSVGNMGTIIYVFEVQTKGSIDSLLMNLMKAKNNPAVQGIVAVSDAAQIEKIKHEAEGLSIKNDPKFWDYNEVLKVYDHLSSAYDSINSLGLVPDGIGK